MIIHGLKTCDTTKKALRALAPKGAVLRDLRAEPLTAIEVSAFYVAFGDRLVNRSSTTWRGLSEAERAGEPVDLILAHPTLMKRPLVAGDGRMTLGWGVAEQAQWLGT